MCTLYSYFLDTPPPPPHTHTHCAIPRCVCVCVCVICVLIRGRGIEMSTFKYNSKIMLRQVPVD